MLTPFQRMLERVNSSKSDSDSAYFNDLMLAGEQLVKICSAGLVASIVDSKQKHKYGLVYRLLRVDGIGDWVSAMDEVLTGPASQYFEPSYAYVQQELTERLTADSWQYQSASLLSNCLRIIDSNTEPLPTKVAGKTWFSDFASLRNATKGHGAYTSEVYSKLCSPLNESIEKLIECFSLFKDIQWAYLYKNYSDKYKVVDISTKADSFHNLRIEKNHAYDNGVYIHLGKPVKVDLMFSDDGLVDFYMPNGGFKNVRFEVLSYITGKKSAKDATEFLNPPGELPSSETEGLGKLDLNGRVFTNLPKIQTDYIKRASLEKELKRILTNDRYPIVTLVGRGGIGKTSLAISVLNELCEDTLFDAIVWFSARDIDLLIEGAKPVKPNVLNEDDIAKEYVRLLEPDGVKNKGFKAKDFLQMELRKSSIGSVLFIFDNFETVASPVDLFQWLDSQIKLPNKILITSRFRDFKADYPIEVKGMSEGEFHALVISTAKMLKIEDIITKDGLIQELYIESDGHPYIAKILLGEFAKEGASGSFKRLIGSKEDILTALFERTYKGLSLSARRIFLTMSNWRTIIPQIAIEAVLARNVEHIDVEEAIEELIRTSLIDIIVSEADNTNFLSIPLSASIFGKKKLSVSSLKTAIEADTKLLNTFGVGLASEIRLGVGPKINKFFRDITRRVSLNREKIEMYSPTLEYLCRKYPPAWLQLAELYSQESRIDFAVVAYQNHIENTTDDYLKYNAWNKLTDLYKKLKDWNGEIHSLIEVCELKITGLEKMYQCVNRINELLKENSSLIDTYEKQIMVQKLVDVYSKKLEADTSVYDGSYYSQLAWLFLRLNDFRSARAAVSIGLSIEPNNTHCLKLKEKVGL